MKKGILLLFIGFLSFGLSAQEVPEVQKSLITKRTATWCSLCGTWGWSFFEGLIEDNADKAVFFAAHFSGELINPTAETIVSNFGGFSQPRFYLGSTDQNVSSGNASTRRTEIQAKVDESFETAPVVNSGINAFEDGETISIDVKTQFFQAAEGEYLVAPYIVEDGVINFQQNQGQAAIHKYILRTSFTENAFGEVVATGNIEAGTTVDQSFSIAIDPAWAFENIEIAVVIWKNNGGDYEFVNVNSTNTFSMPVAVNDIELQDATMLIAPNVATDQAQINITADRTFDEANLILTDLSGRQVAVLSQGTLAAGDHTFELNKAQVNQNGVYFISLVAEGKTLTQKVIFQ